MTDESWVMVAALAAGLAAFVATPAFRLHRGVLGKGPAGSVLGNGPAGLVLGNGPAGPTARRWLHRLRPWLLPAEGAPSPFARAAAAITGGCLLIGLTGGLPVPAPVLGAAGSAAAYLALGRWVPRRRRGRDRVIESELPAACTLLAVCLEAGLPLRNAVAAVAAASSGPMGEVLHRLDTAVRLGVPEPDAWRELGSDAPPWEQLAREIGHAAGSGIALAPVLRHHAAEAQRVASGTAQARARRAGVSSVLPLMLCFLPAFLLIGVVPIVGGVASRMFG